MKEVYQAVIDVLIGDTDLKSMCRYTKKKLNIRRAYVPEGEWDTLVIFYMQAGVNKTDFTSQIRTVPLVVRIYDRKSDLLVEDITERIILLLHGADLDVTGSTYVYDCSYTDDLIPTSYNQNLKCYERVIRFSLQVRYDEVAGTSGYPTRKRKDNNQW